MTATTPLARPSRQGSPQRLARATALLYLTVIVAGVVAQMAISERLVVPGDAVATATNILAQPGLFQLGFTLYLIEMTAQVAQVTLLYFLLRPAGRRVALVALVVGLVGCTIKTLSRLFYIAPLLVLGEGGALAAFSTVQREALALVFLRLNDQAAGMALSFFGLSTLLNGLLVFRSGFLPRLLGLLSIVGGLGWLTYLYPPLGDVALPLVLLVGLIGSAADILWLLIKGVDAERWARRAAEAA